VPGVDDGKLMRQTVSSFGISEPIAHALKGRGIGKIAVGCGNRITQGIFLTMGALGGAARVIENHGAGGSCCGGNWFSISGV